MSLFVDMDGTLVKWRNVDSPEQLYEKGFFLNGEPDLTAVERVRAALRNHHEVFIVSAYLTESEYALKEKKAWLAKYLPEIDEDHQIFVAYRCSKAEAVMRYLGKEISKSDYLLDDYTPNLLDWSIAGGSPIKYLNGINGSHGRWRKIPNITVASFSFARSLESILSI